VIPLIGRFFHNLLWSPERAVLWFRSTVGFVAGVAATVVTAPPETIVAWGWKDWAVRLGVGAVLATALASKAGDKNYLTPKEQERVAEKPPPAADAQVPAPPPPAP